MRVFILKAAAVLLVLYGLLIVVATLAGRSQPRGDQLVLNAVRSTGSGVYLLDADRGAWAHVVTARGDLTHMTVSPDGARIAYAIGGTHRRAGGRSDDLYILDLRTMDTRQIAATPAEERLPTWSPDSARIAYATDADGWSLVVAAVDSGETLRRIGGVRDGFRAWSPRWSPDGSQIAFFSDRSISAGAGQFDIYVVEVASGEFARMTSRSQIYIELAWSPDGAYLLYTAYRGGTSEIYVMDVVSGVERNLSDNIAVDDMAAWSPDGAQIAFRSRRGTQEGVYIADVESGMIRRMTNESAVNFAPAWSPDGARVAFVTAQAVGRMGVFTLPPDDESARPVLRGTAAFVQDMAWRPR